MPLPSFLNIGTMKAGTTSLFHYLESHPQIYLPPAKELHYFVAERNWERGLSWYEEQFSGAGSARILGEASPSYTNFPEWKGVPERIAATLPDVKLIYVVRDPLERMKSHYRHEVIMGRENRSAAEALSTGGSYFYRSCYALQLEQYQPHFWPDRILVVTSEDLRTERQRTMNRVFEFLGVDPEPQESQGEFHKSDEKRRRSKIARTVKSVPGYEKAVSKMPDSLKTRLRDLTHRSVDVPDLDLPPEKVDELRAALAPDVAKLKRMMPSDFDAWGLL